MEKDQFSPFLSALAYPDIIWIFDRGCRSNDSQKPNMCEGIGVLIKLMILSSKKIALLFWLWTQRGKMWRLCRNKNIFFGGELGTCHVDYSILFTNQNGPIVDQLKPECSNSTILLYVGSLVSPSSFLIVYTSIKMQDWKKIWPSYKISIQHTRTQILPKCIHPWPNVIFWAT